MNRLASAFSNAPSTGSETSTQPQNSPLETTYTSHSDGQHPRRRSVSPHPAIYSDPRQTHFPNVSSWERSNELLPRRPGLLRHKTDDGISRSATPTPRNRDKAPVDRSVRVNLLGQGDDNKRGWGMSTLPGSGRITAMVQGPDGRYAVGGGQYLKILKISDPPSGASTPIAPNPADPPLARGSGGASITEVVNLWRGTWGVSKGVNDLDWGVGQFHAKVISACPSGNILVFDTVRGKLEKEISGGHPRPMNVLKVCKTPTHSHLLLSGGTEGQAKLWDLRENNPSMRKHFKHSVPITSIAFSPDMPHNFLVGLDNGSIQRYDMRNHLKAIGRIWGAHGNKAVMDLKWKAGDDGGWLASAGADRTVQIWDMSVSWDRPPTPRHTLHTSFPLRRVAWRPEHDTELAIIPLASQHTSSADPTAVKVRGGDMTPRSIENDAHIEIWDVRRHHIAKYAIASGDGNAIGLEWADENNFVSAFQGGGLAQIEVKSQKRLPIDNIPRQVMAWNCRGEMAYALDQFKSGEIPFDDLKSEYSSHWDKVGRRPKGVGDDRYEPLQAVGVMPALEVAMEEDQFGYLAEHYKLEGASSERLCLWNAEVAESCGRFDDARIWIYLKLLYDEFLPSTDPKFDELVFSHPLASTTKFANPPISPGASPKLGSSPMAIPLERLDSIGDMEELMSSPSSSGSSSGSITTRGSEQHVRSRFSAFAPPDTRRVSESLTARKDSVATVVPTTSARATPRTLFAQAVTAGAKAKERSGSSHSKHSGEDEYPGPYGAVTATPPSRMTSSSKVISDYPDPYGIITKSESSKHSPLASQRPSPKMLAERSRLAVKELSLPSSQGQAGAEQFGEEPWKAYKRKRIEPFLHWWSCYVEDGETQMATSLFVIGQNLVDFPDVQCERIADAYVESLEAHRLPVAAAYIRRYAGIAALEVQAGDEGITHVVTCGRCRKSTGGLDVPLSEGKFWWCKSCKGSARICVICHRGVRGLWLGCGRCKHGGHQKCLRLYYANTVLLLDKHGEKPEGDTTDTDGEDMGRPNWIKGWNVCAKGCGCRCRVVVSQEAGELE